jgi:hypothetical protein
MSNNPDNRRETGARKYPLDKRTAENGTSQDASRPEPKAPYGLAKGVDDTNEKTRHSDGVKPSRRPTPSPAPEKVSGAGPAIAEHSKDAKAPRAGRQPGAYKKS